MSTTVNYKGNTIATLSNETKTLTTAGSWVEGNIEIVDEESIEDKFISVTFNNHLETGNITITHLPLADIVGNSGYVEMTSSTLITVTSGSITRLMPYGFGLMVRTGNITASEVQNFELKMNNTVIDPKTEGKSGSIYYKCYSITKSILDSSNNILDFYSTSDPFKDTVVSDSLSVTDNGTYTATSGTAYTEINVNVPVTTPTLQTKSATPTESSQTITPDTGYDGLSSVEVGAISSTYVGSGVSRKSSTDLTESETENGLLITAPTGYYEDDAMKLVPFASTPEISSISYGGRSELTVEIDVASAGCIGAGKVTLPTAVYIGDVEGLLLVNDEDVVVSGDTVTAPAGFYISSVSKSVASGTTGTPTATKGTVSNHQVSVTPSVTNTTGYIAGGTKTGTAVTVTASELASGNKAISSNGTDIDVVGYSTVSVDVQPNLQSKTGINPSTSSQTISPDSGYYGLSSVQINAMPTMTLPTSASSSATSGYTSKATIGRSTSAQYINIPTGYNSAGAYYIISATPNGTVTAPTSISGTSATVSTGTNTLTLTKTVSVTPNVTTAGYISSGTAGNASVSLTASVNIRSSSDLTVSGATVTAPAGYYSAAASKSVSSMTLPTSAAASATSGYTSKATISRSTSDQYINIPTGYNASGAYYKINAVANGTEGTPTATKGTVSNHSISVTPSVTNTAGYISGGTKTGTAVTVTASELASGNKAIVENGTGIDVIGYSTVSVNVPSDGDFTRIEIVPQQTFTPDSNRQATITGTSAGIVDGAHYGVTYDGVLWVVTCETLWESNFCIGDVRWFFDDNSDAIYPFGVIWADEDGIMTYTVASSTTGQHSIKIERLVFNSEGTALGTKTITSNGTYNASTDSLDGYSTVTVNVSSQGPTLQAKTNISPTTSSQTITADSGYDGLSSVQINAMPTMTLPSSASSTSSGTSKATISRSTSNQYINIPTGYNSTAQYYTISSTPNITLPTATSSTSSGTSKATITPSTSAQYLNIPTGYNGTVQYYTISAVTYSTIRTGTTTPASSLGSNGDVYIKTS